MPLVSQRHLLLVVAAGLVAIGAACQGGGLVERQGEGPRVALPVAWVFGLGSWRFINSTAR